MDAHLTHVNEKGEARMVDVAAKDVTEREAVAVSTLVMRPETLSLITSGQMKKGDVFAVARIAGIMAAKKTSELIPLCHQLPLTGVAMDLAPLPPDRVRITATAKCAYRTGVEMEALTAASVAALTVYDMCKAVDRGMVVESTHLVKKSGGKSGDFHFDGEDAGHEG